MRSAKFRISVKYPQVENLTTGSREPFFVQRDDKITMELAQQKCTTYRVGSPPLTRKETFELLGEVPGWSLANGHLTRMF